MSDTDYGITNWCDAQIVSAVLQAILTSYLHFRILNTERENYSISTRFVVDTCFRFTRGYCKSICVVTYHIYIIFLNRLFLDSAYGRAFPTTNKLMYIDRHNIRQKRFNVTIFSGRYNYMYKTLCSYQGEDIQKKPKISLTVRRYPTTVAYIILHVIYSQYWLEI